MDLEALQNKFVTQDELEEKRKTRQEEWEKVRTASDPVEVPEEPADNRCLYEKLQEQKQKKDDDFEEQFRFRNQVRGLDEDESKFLDFVSDRQEELMKKRENEDKQVLTEYRLAMESQTVVIPEKSLTSKPATGDRPSRPETRNSRKSQQALLGAAVKRKSTSQNEPTTDAKRSNTGSTSTDKSEGHSSTEPAATRALQETDAPLVTGPPARVIGILPGLGAYDGSSDSLDSSDDSTSADEEGLGLLSNRKKCIGHNHAQAH